MEKLSSATRTILASLAANLLSRATGREAKNNARVALDNIAVELGIEGGGSPKNILPLTVERQAFDKTEVYEAIIRKKLKHVAELCQLHGIPFLFITHTEREDDGTEEGNNTLEVHKTADLRHENPATHPLMVEAFRSLVKGSKGRRDEPVQPVDFSGVVADAILREFIGTGARPYGGGTVTGRFTEPFRTSSSPRETPRPAPAPAPEEHTESPEETTDQSQQ